jgi:hypothetical protein
MQQRQHLLLMLQNLQPQELLMVLRLMERLILQLQLDQLFQMQMQQLKVLFNWLAI